MASPEIEAVINYLLSIKVVCNYLKMIIDFKLLRIPAEVVRNDLGVISLDFTAGVRFLQMLWK